MCRTMKELQTISERIYELEQKKAKKKKEMDALEKEIKELKAVEREIIGYMDTNEKVSEIGNNFTIKLSTCERKTLDNKRLEAKLGSLAEYQKVSQYRRLYVK